MTTSRNDEPQNLTRINPRRRMVPPAGPLPLPLVPQAFEAASEDDDEPIADDLDEAPPHPLTSYSDPSRVRWNPALCLIDEIPIEKVRRWDATEDGLKIMQWRIVVQRHGVPEGGGRDAAQWLTLFDQQRDPGDTFADVTRESLRDAFGPGKFRAWLYAAVEDPKTGVVGFPHRRCVRWGAQARVAARPAASGAFAASPVAAAAPARAAEPRPALVPGSSFAEQMQMLEIKARIAREEREAAERSEDRRIARMREEREAADREDERRRARDRDDQERRDREEDRRRTRDREELDRRREDEDRARKRENDLEVRLVDLKSKQLASNADPLAQLKSMRDMIVEADGVFGSGEKSSAASSRVSEMLIEAISAHAPKIMEIAGQIITDRENTNRALQIMNARIAEMQAQRARPGGPAAAAVSAPQASAPKAPAAPAAQHADPRIRVVQNPAPPAAPVSSSPAAAGVPAPVAAPPPVPTVAAAPVAVSSVPAPGLVELPLSLDPSIPCPACGVVGGCVHFPPDEEDDEEDDDDFCDLCADACTHDESTYGPDGCAQCPDCAHGGDE
jgi:hypothetical protein